MKVNPAFSGHKPGEYVRRLVETAHAGSRSSPCASVQDLERLVSMQYRVSRGYSRLLDAHRMLRARRPEASRSPGAAIAEARERERQRISRELHSGVGQALSGINIHLGIMQRLLPEPPEEVRESMERIGMLMREALVLVRGISRGLYAPTWQGQPLCAALRSLWEASGISKKFAGSLELQELSAEPPPDVRAVLYRAAQEGLSNVIRHSQARCVRLSLRVEHGRVTLEVADDGRGFNAELAFAQPAGFAGIGLPSMREAARQLGGDLHVQSGSQGTILTISLPENP